MFKNTKEIIKKFTSNTEDKKTDYLKRENSNFVYSLPLLRHNVNNYAEDKFLMEEILPPKLVELYKDGVVYIHDKQLSSYCLSVGCKDVATFGIPTLAKNMLSSEPASSLDTLLRHFSNVVVLMAQQVSGAVMLSQMTTIAASYLWFNETEANEKYSDKKLKKLFRNLIWELNLPLRSGSQSAFSNITMEFGKSSEEIKDEYVIVDGNVLQIKYKDIPEKYFDRINKAIIDVMADGTGVGLPFTFPLITIQIDDDFNYNNKLFLYLLDKMYSWGGVYFENFKTKPFENEYYTSLNPTLKPKNPEVSRSLCCRLQIDLSLLSQVGSGIFGSSTGSTGAVQVLNLNLNRVMMEFGHDENLLREKILEYLEVMQEGHQAKRNWIEANKELYPTFFAFNKDLRNYFNVFAVTGMNEGLINIGYENGLKNKEGKEFAHNLMQYINEVINSFIVRDKVACGVEFAPAENAGIKLARHDVKWANKNGKEIFVQGTGDDVFLTSGCMLPFSEDDFLQQIENAAEFQGYATSGSILHHFLESKVEPSKLANYLDKLFEKPINYITLTPTITSCMECGNSLVAVDGKNVDKCPVCSSTDIATFSRVIGYIKMISRGNIKVDDKGYYIGDFNFWSNARRFDWNERKRFKENNIEELRDQDKG